MTVLLLLYFYVQRKYDLIFRRLSKRHGEISARFYIVVMLSLWFLIGNNALAQTSVFINEIHYDNAGGDKGEAVEVAGPAGADLTGWRIVLYNGNNNASYGTISLNDVIPNLGGGFGMLAFSKTGLQNGPSDALAMVDDADIVVQFLSYEGTLTAVGGPADGMTSTNIGVSESGSTPVGYSLQLGGSGQFYEHFTWESEASNSFGAFNNNQTFIQPCSITDLAAGDQTACDSKTNKYTQEIVVTYSNPPATGTLDVNGQSFAIGVSPQTVTLTGLTADGQPVDVTALFSDDPGCIRTEDELFYAPADCTPSSDIIETLEMVLDAIDALIADPATPDKSRKNLVRVSKKLGATLNYLVNERVDKAFEELIKAVKSLMQAEKNGAAVSDLIDSLVMVSLQIAQDVIDVAQQFTGDPDVDKELAKAEKQMTEAQKDLDRGKPDKAIKHYKKAYKYAQKAIKLGGGLPKTWLTDETEQADTKSVPAEFELAQNYPNPFNPSTTITFSVPEAGDVTLSIYNLRGRLVQTLVAGAVAAGRQSAVWKGRDSRGLRVASGIYVYRLTAKDFVATRKLAITK